MVGKHKGVSLNGSRLRIRFEYLGKPCSEQVGTGTLPKDWTAATILRHRVLAAIEMGTFSYADYFPESTKLATFGEYPKKSHTFAEYAEIWFGTLKLEKSSLKAYRASLNSFWIPNLGHKLLGVVKKSDISTIISKSTRVRQFAPKNDDF